MTDDVPNNRSWQSQTVEQAKDAYQQIGDIETVICFVCSHSVYSHYEGDTGAGCVALSPPKPSLGAMLSNVPIAPMIDGGSGCLCPGYLQGRLPHKILKHLDGLAYEDEEIDCVDCGHGLGEHDEHYGCWSCPCEINERPTQ